MAIQYARNKTGNPSVQPIIRTLQSYTPASTAGFGAVTVAFMELQRNAGRLQGNIRFTAGTVTSAIAEFSLPPGLTGRMGALASGVVGRWTRVATAGGTPKSGPLLIVGGSSAFAFGLDDTAGTANPIAQQIGTAISGTGAVMLLNFDVPIEGWETHEAIGAGMSSLVTPGLVYQSDWIDIASQVSSAQGSFSVSTALAQITKDKNGTWFIEGVVVASFANANLTSDLLVSVTIAGFTAGGGYQVGARWNGAGGNVCPAGYNSSNVLNAWSRAVSGAGIANGVSFTFKFPINAKPSWA